jgi:hypothetical protein
VAVHLSDAQAAAFIHAQLDPAQHAAARAHLVGCATCSQRVRDLELADREVADLLGRLDFPVPPAAFTPLRVSAGRPRRRRLGPLGAGIAVACVAAAAAAAVPSSPVRRALDRAAEVIRAGRDEPSTPAPRPTPSEQERTAGVAIVPRREIEVRFRRPQAHGTLRIAFGDQVEASLRSSVGNPGYAVAEDRIVVDNADSDASYELTVPRALGEVRVRVADVLVFQKRGDRVTGHARPDSTHGFIVRLDSAPTRAP